MSDDQEAVVWDLVEHGYTAIFETHTLDKQKMLQLGLTWKGISNFLGWGGVAPRLQKEVRGPLAYVMGHRYLRLKQPSEAAVFFRTAREDAPAESRLQHLAKVELRQLELANKAVKP